ADGSVLVGRTDASTDGAHDDGEDSSDTGRSSLVGNAQVEQPAEGTGAEHDGGVEGQEGLDEGARCTLRRVLHCARSESEHEGELLTGCTCRPSWASAARKSRRGCWPGRCVR